VADHPPPTNGDSQTNSTSGSKAPGARLRKRRKDRGHAGDSEAALVRPATISARYRSLSGHIMQPISAVAAWPGTVKSAGNIDNRLKTDGHTRRLRKAGAWQHSLSRSWTGQKNPGVKAPGDAHRKVPNPLLVATFLLPAKRGGGRAAAAALPSFDAGIAGAWSGAPRPRASSRCRRGPPQSPGNTLA
jgi:hypothetical protein